MGERGTVLDTNVVVSRLLAPASVPARAVDGALQGGVLVSEATLQELAKVLARPKFDPYATRDERERFFALFARVAVQVVVHHRVQARRDPKDDGALEVAVNGDADLLALHPFRGVVILTPGAFPRP
ncbi:MAG: putative toxin-antitoxin system toxin component, PIN family [Geminicoccaceae bacterium]|nr:putative toxin-antitoxin system toxin component, PIN family [Geminicoccaceae bacterium]